MGPLHLPGYAYALAKVTCKIYPQYICMLLNYFELEQKVRALKGLITLILSKDLPNLSNYFFQMVLQTSQMSSKLC